jgi:hypothetical protein
MAHNEKNLAFVGELAFRQPITEVDDCNIADDSNSKQKLIGLKNHFHFCL